jgi:hypothetical protein
VDGNGFVVGLDALLIINQMNNLPPYIDPVTRKLPDTPTAPNLPPYYVDANGDGFLTGADALAIINYLNLVAAEARAGATSGLRVANAGVDAAASPAPSEMAAVVAMGAASGASAASGAAAAAETTQVSTALVSAGSSSAGPASAGSGDDRGGRSRLADVVMAGQGGGSTSRGQFATTFSPLTSDLAELGEHFAPSRIEARGGVSGKSSEAAARLSAGLGTTRIADKMSSRAAARANRIAANIFAEHAEGDDSLALDDIVPWRASAHRQHANGEAAAKRADEQHGAQDD